MNEYLAALLQKLYKLADYDNLRTAGEVASMTPTPLGDVASGMLAVDDLRKGNYGDAALNAVGLLPFIPAMGGVTKIKNYPLEEIGKWYGDANYRQTGGKMVEMTPDDYISQVRKLNIDELSRENIDELKNHIKKGGKLDPLAIYKSGKEDGRHRAYAAKELGIKVVPVIDWR